MGDKMMFPKHSHFSLEHNPHKACYETINEYLDGLDERINTIEPTELKKCLELNELWVLQIYPTTPIGFYWFAASNLEKLLEMANKTQCPKWVKT